MSLSPLPAWVSRANTEQADADSGLGLSAKARRAVLKYGRLACVQAYRMSAEQGEGARTIALTGPITIKTTRQADAAISAGREIIAALAN